MLAYGFPVMFRLYLHTVITQYVKAFPFKGFSPTLNLGRTPVAFAIGIVVEPLSVLDTWLRINQSLNLLPYHDN